MQQWEDFYLFSQYIIKLIIKTYDNINNEVISLVLKLFLNLTKIYIFLSLWQKWQEHWLISVCKKNTILKTNTENIYISLLSSFFWQDKILK